MFRKRPPHPSLAAFMPVAEPVDRAQRALLSAVPTSRDAGIPLPLAIEEFRRFAADARAAMDRWKEADAESSDWHDRCAAALDAALREAGELERKPPEGFEALNARIGDVLHPLEEFADAERTLRKRR